ncbi:anaphase-promoting complex subunit 10-like isoform X1 [Photinus pyralis]|uniref:anaphase-promoting complex subunit 10-like isoform X1 n=1 Tax=Photinus pyralis TaxID=7054 RepID=UPI001267260E|nr:anaphase-promoting complex subunit 10-like isoform X1 [Photinus pyralis]XP_031340528.1 anaphase-promoting complex subunit 10-like isoform X1 [Photinus pyralis]XP_031350714.1 anaphase-promoting complex subunit 10-like isoform X1 [Photinus pyralis]XP_031350715.1 anaphase-promoting complex subunit 10-like isoform X1 [Photinus pyralis]
MTTKQSQEVDPVKNERMGNVREVGSQAIWSLSSCKPGFGVEQLRDDRTDTYWQSDGQLPHLVNIQFQRKTTVSDIFIYSEYKLDESYTPSRISIRIGTHFNDLQEIEVVMLTEPTGMGVVFYLSSFSNTICIGWVHIPIKDVHDKPIRMFMIQIAVTSNHQNGRDTHMRQIKIHSPTEGRGISMDNFANFSSLEFVKYATIR